MTIAWSNPAPATVLIAGVPTARPLAWERLIAQCLPVQVDVAAVTNPATPIVIPLDTVFAAAIAADTTKYRVVCFNEAWDANVGDIKIVKGTTSYTVTISGSSTAANITCLVFAKL